MGRFALAGAAAGLLAACNGGPAIGPVPERPNERASRIEGERQGSLAEVLGGGQVRNSNVRLGTGGGEALIGAPVNRHIWRAAIDTLAFLPIASTDPYSGVIATDWGVVEGNAEERVKVTAFVTDVELSPASLRVAVFRQARDAQGAWVQAPVAAQTAEQVEDAILTRARQLRLEEESAGG
ncbi:MAG: DUF3576 domain-containing protein [Rubrimonas sp.]|uniref:DUF3576 domain-containing protein n=1 Tax=Rubrimonas sp. TaxID=2036015 RepID=UPI002FDCAC51